MRTIGVFLSFISMVIIVAGLWRILRGWRRKHYPSIFFRVFRIFSDDAEGQGGGETTINFNDSPEDDLWAEVDFVNPIPNLPGRRAAGCGVRGR